ncbi:uncharacterized protein LOC129250113 [Anastrepha obliqua]|uniref:uncharacterized protein LOC129250113 n=1 Tax=Anastrepha obliqua TaxID=95512 RepID=UPI00240A1E86|nr:uncharacterized protein LOC129250113 [Anastrepha obliqua]
MSHEREAPSDELCRLVKEAEQRKLALVIGSDANSHHTTWGSSDTNHRDDLTVVALEGCKDETLLFGSCYMPHDGEAPQTELRKLVETAASKKHALVVGTDANAHHPVWGSADINDRGESLFTYILQSSLEIANRGEELTYVGPTSKNVLDLTLYTSRHVMVQEWEVLSTPSFSDHRYISFRAISGTRWFEGTEEYSLIVRNAFNTVNWAKILDSLDEIGVSPYLRAMIRSYFEDLVLDYDTAVGRKSYKVSGGVPQDSVLGPLLWNNMYDGVLRLNIPNGANIIGFVDDVSVVITTKKQIGQ